MTEVASANSTASTLQSAADTIQSGIEAVASLLHSIARLQCRFDDNHAKLQLKFNLRKEAEADSRHGTRIFTLLNEDIQRLTEDQESLKKEMRSENQKLSNEYEKITKWLITQQLLEVKGELKKEIVKHAKEQDEELAKQLRTEFTKSSTVDIPHLTKKVEKMAEHLAGLETKLKSDLRKMDDDRQDLIATNLGNVYRTTAQQIEELSRAHTTTSHDLQDLVQTVKDVQKGAARQSDFRDLKDSVSRLKSNVIGLALIDRLERVERNLEDKQKDMTDRVRRLNAQIEALQQKFGTVEKQTLEYNRRSSELDIVYESIKSHIESLRKDPEANKAPPLAPIPSSHPEISAAELTDIRSQISNLSSQIAERDKLNHTSLPASELTDIRNNITKMSEQIAHTERIAQKGLATEDVDDIKAQIAKLSAQMAQKEKFNSNFATADDLAAMQTQISRLTTQLAQKGQIDRQGIVDSDASSNLEVQKSLSYLEAKLIVLEQSHKLKMDQLELSLSNLNKKRTADAVDDSSNTKRLRADGADPLVTDLKKQLEELSAQVKEVMTFLEPLRQTVLGDEFGTNLQNSLNQLISVARRHEQDIKAAHGVLEKVVRDNRTESRSPNQDDAQQVFKLQLDTHQRKVDEKQEQLLDHVRRLTEMYTKSQEKESQQQVQIDKFNQQLTAATFLIDEMFKALTKNGIAINGQANDKDKDGLGRMND